MQVNLLKKVIYFLTFLLLTLQLAYSQSNATRFNRADSLFKATDYDRAEQLYNQLLPTLEKPSGVIYLKLAKINETKGDYLKTLLYLNKSYEQNPDQRILLKLNDIAKEYNLKGYELNDFNFLILFYKQYSGFLIAFMLVMAIYIFWVLIQKRYTNQYIPTNQKVFLTLYLTGIAILLNLPDKYHQAIINTDNVFLRSEPSGGAEVVESIAKGHRLNIIGGNDIWRRVYWDDRILYVKQSDVWQVE